MTAWPILITGCLMYGQGFLTAYAVRGKLWAGIGGGVSGLGLAAIVFGVWHGALHEGWFA